MKYVNWNVCCIFIFLCPIYLIKLILALAIFIIRTPTMSIILIFKIRTMIWHSTCCFPHVMNIIYIVSDGHAIIVLHWIDNFFSQLSFPRYRFINPFVTLSTTDEYYCHPLLMEFLLLTSILVPTPTSFAEWNSTWIISISAVKLS